MNVESSLLFSEEAWTINSFVSLYVFWVRVFTLFVSAVIFGFYISSKGIITVEESFPVFFNDTFGKYKGEVYLIKYILGRLESSNIVLSLLWDIWE